ncbi:MAG: DUF177 domain-containing protein [Actinobacteria bacterium]|nr:DUF177 domain-containing protein [Actinomycetota bacterium]
MTFSAPKGPFVIEVREPGRRVGHSKHVTASAMTADAMGTAVIGVLPGSTIDLDITLQAVGEGILVTGTATAPVVGECSRCLTEIRYPEQIELADLFSYPPTDARGRVLEAEMDNDEDTLWVADDHIDLEPVITDALVLGLPLAPLCRPDCPGLCPECGESLAEQPEHSHPLHDPRWAALATLSPLAEDAAEGDPDGSDADDHPDSRD